MNPVANQNTGQSAPPSAGHISKLSDDQLFIMAKHFGANALLWRQKFIGLLPEIQKRRIHTKKNFESIFVFAKKLAGLSEEQVRRVLSLDKKFDKMPKLKLTLVNGEASINKLARIASIATPENEEALAEKVRILPQSAIETLVRDEKFTKKNNHLENFDFKNQNGLFEPKTQVKFVRTHKFESERNRGNALNLSKEVTEKLLQLQEKGMDINEILLEMLEKREKEIEDEKTTIAKELRPTQSRHIPAKVQNVLRKEHGKKCSIPNCHKEAIVIHHTQPFAMSKLHDPRFLAPLCKDHHEIAHSINLKVQEKRAAL